MIAVSIAGVRRALRQAAIGGFAEIAESDVCHVKANGLSVSHRASGGVTTATAPDVCKTPPGPVPIPYPNISLSSDLADGSSTVSADGGQMVSLKGSEFSKSTGDEPGVAGGVKSGTNKKSRNGCRTPST